MNLDFLLNILYVAFGLGMVIFVHELGHFAVAKFCGVRCDKFYLGFDIGGLKFCKFKWGETEYGIGILPLGGYVKMLGQEDSPGRIKEELERAKLQEAEKAAGAESEETVSEGEEPLRDVKTLEEALYDPRSYLAKSVPQRMAIISAGVIMNLVFAVIAAMVAYGVGVNHIAAGIGGIMPGGAAWEAGLEVGDEVLEINGEPVKEFRQLQTLISLSKEGEPVQLKVERKVPGTSQAEMREITLEPNRTGLIPTIGVISPSTTKLEAMGKLPPCSPGTVAFEAQPPFEAEDQIVEINGQPVDDYGTLYRLFSQYREQPITLTVLRQAEKGKEPQRVKVQLPPQPMRRVGLVMALGPVDSIRKGSVAQQAGMQPGDQLKSIDGQEPGDPMTLANRIRRKVGQPVRLTLTREGKDVELTVTPAPVERWDMSFLPNSPVTIPSLGVAFEVLNRVVATVPDSPAAGADVQPGSVLKSVVLVPPKAESVEKLLGKEDEKEWKPLLKEIPLAFDGENRNWSLFYSVMQRALPGSRVRLIFDGDAKPVEMDLVAVGGQFNPDRGFAFGVPVIKLRAESFGQMVGFGLKETWASSKQIFVLLNRLLTGQISPKVLGGPITIVQAASSKASQGLSKYLLFLTLLSANLAVINFLPIPVLDGGHMVFLSYELVRGKPASESIQITLSYLGLLFILGLMVWVIGLDITRMFGM